jgi:hypothetical protein
MRTKQQTKTIKTPKCPWIPNRQTHAWVLPDLAWPVIGFSWIWIMDGHLILLGRSSDLCVRVQSELRRASGQGAVGLASNPIVTPSANIFISGQTQPENIKKCKPNLKNRF